MSGGKYPASACRGQLGTTVTKQADGNVRSAHEYRKTLWLYRPRCESGTLWRDGLRCGWSIAQRNVPGLRSDVVQHRGKGTTCLAIFFVPFFLCWCGNSVGVAPAYFDLRQFDMQLEIAKRTLLA
jgi:hypothetical protein